MKPTDFRDMTFEGLQKWLSRDRERVYLAWLQHGPGTTREVAVASAIGILTFRPRTTQLYQAGLIELMGDQRAGHQGVYRAVPLEVWRRRREAAPKRAEQMVMGI